MANLVEKGGEMKLIMNDTDYFHYEEPLISLEFCPNGGFHCHDILKHINKYLSAANACIQDKDYGKALDYKMMAFEKTDELTRTSCIKCRDLLRKRVSESVDENIEDLTRMTKGIFRKKKYIPLVERAETVKQRMTKISRKFKKPSPLRKQKKRV